MRNITIRKQEVARDELSELTSTITKANAGSLANFDKVFALGYGRIGSFRHHLLKQHLKDLQPSRAALKPMHPLLKSHVGHPSATVLRKGPVFPERDESIQGPLHWRRRKNIINKWWQNKVVDRIRAPLSTSGIASLEKLVRGEFGFTPPRASSRSTMLDTLSDPSPKVVQKLQLRTITKRFVRRRAALLLDQVPIIDVTRDTVGLSPVANSLTRHKKVKVTKKGKGKQLPISYESASKQSIQT